VGASSPFERKNYFKMEINKKEKGPNNNKNDQLLMRIKFSLSLDPKCWNNMT
jgi:hypothetical protein